MYPSRSYGESSCYSGIIVNRLEALRAQKTQIVNQRLKQILFGKAGYHFPYATMLKKLKPIRGEQG